MKLRERFDELLRGAASKLTIGDQLGTAGQIELLVMRLANMHKVHPSQIESSCSQCGEVVAVYPSGQRIMRKYPGKVVLVCNVCRKPSPFSRLAPGALQEPKETHRKQ